MKYVDNIKVYPKHTDCYNVVWHGCYIEWFEQGRVNFCDLAGVGFRRLYENGILLPVVEINCRYKASAHLMDELVVTTELKELKQASLLFEQTVQNKKNGNDLVKAFVKIVATDIHGKMYRKLPDILFESFSGCLKDTVIT